MDPGSAPQPVGEAHVVDQLEDFKRHLWSAPRERDFHATLIRSFRAGGSSAVPQFSRLQRFVDLQDGREIFLTQLGRLGLEFMLQRAQLCFVKIFGFR